MDVCSYLIRSFLSDSQNLQEPCYGKQNMYNELPRGYIIHHANKFYVLISHLLVLDMVEISVPGSSYSLLERLGHIFGHISCVKDESIAMFDT